MELKKLSQETKSTKSQESKTEDNSMDLSQETVCTGTSSQISMESQESDVGNVDLNISGQLQELNSLLNARTKGKGRGKKPKTSTPRGAAAAKAVAGRGKPSKVSNTYKIWGNPMSRGRTGASSLLSAALREIAAEKSRSNNNSNQNLQAPVPVGRRRSGRLADKNNDSVQETPARDNIKVIDLISAPPLIMPGVVNLDSDDEDKQKQETRKKALADLSFEDNYEMSIKVRWNGKVEKHTLRKHQRFEDLIKKFAELENVDENRIILTLGDTKVIQPDDTPDSIGCKITTILSEFDNFHNNFHDI